MWAQIENNCSRFKTRDLRRLRKAYRVKSEGAIIMMYLFTYFLIINIYLIKKIIFLLIVFEKKILNLDNTQERNLSFSRLIDITYVQSVSTRHLRS